MDGSSALRRLLLLLFEIAGAVCLSGRVAKVENNLLIQFSGIFLMISFIRLTICVRPHMYMKK